MKKNIKDWIKSIIMILILVAAVESGKYLWFMGGLVLYGVWRTRKECWSMITTYYYTIKSLLKGNAQSPQEGNKPGKLNDKYKLEFLNKKRKKE